jgi:hypothetical protein
MRHLIASEELRAEHACSLRPSWSPTEQTTLEFSAMMILEHSGPFNYHLRLSGNVKIGFNAAGDPTIEGQFANGY